MNDGTSRLEKFSITCIGVRMWDYHTFACPVFALQSVISAGNTIPRWSPRAQLGLNFDPSPFQHGACTWFSNIHSGKQLYGMNYYETYVPMVTWFTIWFMITLAIMQTWLMRQINFMQANKTWEFQGLRLEASHEPIRSKTSWARMESIHGQKTMWNWICTIPHWWMCILPRWCHFHCARQRWNVLWQ